jgi:hypothetical protein
MPVRHGSTRYADVQGFPGYRVGTDGSVWSCWFRVGHSRRAAWHLSSRWLLLKSRKTKNGYFIVSLHPGAPTPMPYVHHLVLLAFVGPRPANMVCRHMDGDKSNNRLDNLTWGTYAENENDKVLHGRSNRGSRQGSAILNEEKVKEIKLRLASGEKRQSIAVVFGVSKHAIDGIAWGKRWKHVR